MKLIIGLGNPGEKYKDTRHNVGFMVVDELARRIANSQWSMVKKFSSLIIDYQSSIIFCKPQTFMNSSGFAVSKLASFYKVSASDIWVIHDDLDIKLGEYKIQKGVGPKLHYGIQSIERSLGTKDFWRVRVGVENRDVEFTNKKTNLIKQIVSFQSSRRIPGEEYVLQNFTSDEKEVLRGVIDEIVGKLVGLIIKI